MNNNTSETFINMTSPSKGLRLVDIIYVPLEILLMIFICTGNLLVILVVGKYKVGIQNFFTFLFSRKRPLNCGKFPLLSRICFICQFCPRRRRAEEKRSWGGGASAIEFRDRGSLLSVSMHLWIEPLMVTLDRVPGRGVPQSRHGGASGQGTSARIGLGYPLGSTRYSWPGQDWGTPTWD